MKRKRTRGHEKRDVYRLSIGYITWFFEEAFYLGGAGRFVDLGASIPISIPIAISIPKELNSPQTDVQDAHLRAGDPCRNIRGIISRVRDQVEQIDMFT